jgi:hypothetical protein
MLFSPPRRQPSLKLWRGEQRAQRRLFFSFSLTPGGSTAKEKDKYLCDLRARLNSLSFYVLYTLFKNTMDENFYVGFTKNLKLRFEQHEQGLVEARNLEDL